MTPTTTTPATVTTGYKWEACSRLEKGGHRIFREDRGPYAAPETRRWAIADNSGLTPELTDDGVLWLDFDRPLVVDLSRGYGLLLSIPVRLDPDRRRGRHDVASSHCLAGGAAFAALRTQFPDWRFELDATARTFIRACLPG